MPAQVPQPTEVSDVMSLPPLSLSSGPAVSGGGSISTPLQTGDFVYSPNRPTVAHGVTGVLPVLAVLAVATVLIFRK